MTKTLVISSLITLLFVGLLIFKLRSSKGEVTTPLISAATSPVSNTPISSPTTSPRDFKFDKNTDLKNELNKVNPEILESDFE